MSCGHEGESLHQFVPVAVPTALLLAMPRLAPAGSPGEPVPNLATKLVVSPKLAYTSSPEHG